MEGREMVKNLFIEPTECTPAIRFDPEQDILEIRGSSYPENTVEFYGPVFFWLEEYFRHLRDNTVIVNLEPAYFNSNSWKVIMGFFEVLDSATSKGGSITVNWFHEKDEEDILEYGKEFQEEFPRITFRFVYKPHESL